MVLCIYLIYHTSCKDCACELVTQYSYVINSVERRLTLAIELHQLVDKILGGGCGLLYKNLLTKMTAR